MTGSRLRGLTLVVALAFAALVLLAWSQQWFTLTLGTTKLNVSGQVAGGALLPLALAGGALVAALALAGLVFRVILGLLEALLGVAVIAVSVFALGNPAVASATSITAATGISGAQSIHDLVTGVATTAWPVVAIIAGALLILLGLAIVVTGRAWPVSGRKYTRTRTVAAEGDAIASWDALSEGDDPTAAR